MTTRTRAIGYRRLMFLLAGLSMFGPFAIDTIFPAFPQIGAEFGADKILLQQSISSYLFAYAAMSLVHGPLSDSLGRRPVMLWGVALFALGSVGCALSTSMPMLLFFRAVQGLSAGVGMIVGRAVIRDLHTGPDAQRLMSQVSMIFGIAPAIAPIIGGWILGWGHWRDIFWFLTAFTGLLFIAVFFVLRESHLPAFRSPLRLKPLATSYRSIVSDRVFQKLSFVCAMHFAGFFIYIASAPEFVLHHLRMGQGDFGWFFAPAISGLVLGAYLSSYLAGRVHPDRQVNLGFWIGGVAVVLNLLYNYVVTSVSLPWAVIPLGLYSLSIALAFPVLNLKILDEFPYARGGASSLQAFVSTAMNAVVAGVASPLVSGATHSLAWAMAVFFLLGLIGWMWYRRSSGEVLTSSYMPAGS